MEENGPRGITKGLMTLGEAANFFRVGKRAINEWIRAGKLQACRPGGHRRVIVESVERLIEATRINEEK